MTNEQFIRFCKTCTPEQLCQINGVNVNARDKNGNTPLMVAAGQNSSPEVVEMLLQAGADVNEKDENGFTALMLAAKDNSDPEMVRVLLDAGADISAQNSKGKTVLDLARLNPNPEVAIALGLAGEIPLVAVAEVGSPETITKLLQAGADVNEKDENGFTALMLAAKNGSVKTMQMLLQAGADINAQSNDGFTTLMLAALSNCNHDVIMVLLQAGADLTAQNKYGLTALDTATLNPNPGVAGLLKLDPRAAQILAVPRPSPEEVAALLPASIKKQSIPVPQQSNTSYSDAPSPVATATTNSSPQKNVSTTSSNASPKDNPEDAPDMGLNILALLIPPLGLIVGAIMLGSSPKKGGCVMKWAVAGFIIGVVLYACMAAISGPSYHYRY